MARTDSALIVVVCDAGPLIHLDELGCLDLLADFETILVPQTVWDEVQQHRPTALTNSRISLRLVSSTPPSKQLLSLAQQLPLHQGELEALQLMLDARGQLLLSDDTAARLAAKSLQIAVHGTIGVLFRAIRRQQRSSAEVADLLRSIPTRSTLHIKSKELPLDVNWPHARLNELWRLTAPKLGSNLLQTDVPDDGHSAFLFSRTQERLLPTGCFADIINDEQRETRSLAFKELGRVEGRRSSAGSHCFCLALFQLCDQSGTCSPHPDAHPSPDLFR